jgi:hypothetical protein
MARRRFDEIHATDERERLIDLIIMAETRKSEHTPRGITNQCGERRVGMLVFRAPRARLPRLKMTPKQAWQSRRMPSRVGCVLRDLNRPPVGILRSGKVLELSICSHARH